ncbi:FUSC family protein [Knoellia locipacati]|uniref:FUSC family protein n=1 Tax=Knoellia locipacati TaxID=882824 RepID=UPI00384B2FD0
MWRLAGRRRTGPTARPPTLDFGVRDLLRLNPVPPGSHRIALRAGISVAVPLLTVVALGRTPWAVYAAFGAFTSLYGRNHVHLPRAVMQATAAVGLVTCVALGALLAAGSAGPWVLVLAAVGVAGLGSVASTVLDWHPSGPLFLIFALGTVSATDAAWSDVPVAIFVSAASAAFALAVGSIGAVVARTPSRPRPRLASPRSPDPLRYMLAVAVAGAVATAAGLGHPWWAMVAAAAPLSVRGRSHQALRAGHRIAGTLLGLLTSIPLLLLELDPVPLVLVVVVLQVVTELLVGRNYGLALLFITPMALLMGQLGTAHSSPDLLLDRGVETLIGAAAAVLLLAVENRRAHQW